MVLGDARTSQRRRAPLTPSRRASGLPPPAPATLLFNPQSLSTSLPTSRSPHCQVDGGDPLVLDGNPVLCARSDDPVGRHYDGELAHLSLFDVALEEEQVV